MENDFQCNAYVSMLSQLYWEEITVCLRRYRFISELLWMSRSYMRWMDVHVQRMSFSMQFDVSYIHYQYHIASTHSQHSFSLSASSYRTIRWRERWYFHFEILNGVREIKRGEEDKKNTKDVVLWSTMNKPWNGFDDFAMLRCYSLK